MGKRIVVTILVILALLAALVGPPGQVANAAALPTATIVDLGALPGDTASFAYAVNGTGQVVGHSSAVANGAPALAAAPEEGESEIGRAFLYSDGAMSNLHEAIIPDAPEGSSTFAYGINASGQVVGWAKVASASPSSSPVAAPAAHGDEEEGATEFAYLYDDGTAINLGTLGGHVSQAFAINAKGQVAGQSSIGSGPSHAFLWQNGQMTDLGTLGGMASYGRGINDKAHVVGWANTSQGPLHAFRWNPHEQKMMDLGTLPGGRWSRATAINNGGVVVGYAMAGGGGFHAFLWQGEVMIDLGKLPNSAWSRATDINNRNQVVGYASIHAEEEATVAEPPEMPGEDEGDGEGEHAILWTEQGGMVDLNDFLPADSGWVLVEAQSINDAGQVVGVGTHNGATRAFLLTLPPALTVTTVGNGTVAVAPDAEFHAPGSAVTLTATPGDGALFIGWTIDGAAAGWASPLTLTMNASHSVVATFSPAMTFPDVPAGDPAYAAITQLTTRGIILGYEDGTFGPGDTALRAQMAALIVRAMGWDGETWPNPFTDQNGLDAALWQAIGTLAHYEVADGYGDGRFGPNDLVTQAQTISFIARAMVAKGYWTAQPGTGTPYTGVPAVHSADVATFYYHTQVLGGIPDAPTTGTGWNAAASRAWFAHTLWQALDSYLGTDRVP